MGEMNCPAASGGVSKHGGDPWEERRKRLGMDRPRGFKGKYAVITGASGGIALASARMLAERGAPWHHRHPLAPGTTLTERVDNLVTPEKPELFIGMTPAGRLADPQDIAEAVLFLASDQSRYLSGVTSDVNGGRLMVL